MPCQSKIDKDELERLCIQQIPEKEVAEYFGVDYKTVNTFCKKHFGMTFTIYSQQKRLMGKTKLVNKAMELAEKNGAVMIFLLKNWCGMRDVPETDAKSEGVTDDMKKWFENVKGKADDGTDKKAD